jgi:hypothetical protein
VLENRVLKRVYGPKREEVTGDRRRVHNEELHNLYASPYVIGVIKSRRMGRAVRVARMEEIRNVLIIFVGKSEVRGHSEDLGVDGRIIFF